MQARASHSDSTPPGPARTVLVIDTDAPLIALLAEWLAADGIEVRSDRDAEPAAPCDLLIVDLAFPRQDGERRVARVALEHPATPIIAISSAFLPGLPCRAKIASVLGVAAVLPKPMRREELQSTVQRLLQR